MGGVGITSIHKHMYPYMKGENDATTKNLRKFDRSQPPPTNHKITQMQDRGIRYIKIIKHSNTKG